MGVSVENNKHGFPRVDILREIPAVLRLMSCEPLLEDIGDIDLQVQENSSLKAKQEANSKVVQMVIKREAA